MSRPLRSSLPPSPEWLQAWIGTVALAVHGRFPLRVRHWPAGLAVLGMLTLLLAFHQVVSGAVAQAGQRHANAAAQALAVARCQSHAGRGPRDACVAALRSSAAAEASMAVATGASHQTGPSATTP